MHDTVHIILDITKDIVRNVKYWFDNNIRNLPSLLNIVLPYLMYFLGIKLKLNYIYLVIPIIVYLISYYSKSYANKINKGSSIPVPLKRFTSEDEYGEISISQDRLSELILYKQSLKWIYGAYRSPLRSKKSSKSAIYYRYNLSYAVITALTGLIQAFIQHYNYRGINIMTDKERLQAFKENLFDIRRCIDEGVPCPYGICNECIASDNYRDFLSLIHTDLTDDELREKEYNNYEQRRKETE